MVRDGTAPSNRAASQPIQEPDSCFARFSFEAKMTSSGTAFSARAEDLILDAPRSYGIMHRVVAEAAPSPLMAGKPHDDGHRQQLQVGIVIFFDSPGTRCYNV